MKKRILVAVCIVIAFMFIPILFSYKTKEFTVENYRAEIEMFRSYEVCNSINTSIDARKEAEKIWIKNYGREIKKQRPYQTYYDKKNNIWLVKGSISPFYLGGEAYILIEKSGKVLAVWHEK